MSIVSAIDNGNTPVEAVSLHSQRAKTAYVPRPVFPTDEQQGKGWERSIIAKAHRVPEGLTITRNEGIWFAAVRKSAILNRRKDCAQNILAVVKALINLHRRTSTTIAATWNEIATMAQVSESTVSRTLAELRAHGLLVTIASGKSARGKYTQNWAPVYALTHPEEKKVYEASESPSHLKESNTSFNARANEKISYDQRNRRAFAQAYRDCKGDFGKKNQKPVSVGVLHRKKAYIQAARCLQNHSFALRGLSVKAILHETKAAFQQGWTVGDIITALEQRPTGEIWQTSGAGGMKSIQAWLRLRLSAWKASESDYLPSYSQKRERAHQEHLQKRAAESVEKVKVIQKPAPGWFSSYRQMLKMGKHEEAAELLAQHQGTE